jgi:recombination protein RecT
MPELVPVSKRVQSLRELLQKLVPQMSLALPPHMNAERMARIALTSALRTPKLLEADPASFAGAMLTCAQLGLEPDGREAHLVPFWNSRRKVTEVQVIPDYRGLAKLARQSGEIRSLDWREVRQGDRFEYQYGAGAYLKHVPADEPAWVRDESGEWREMRPITHCYAIATLTSGEILIEVMRREDIERHRDRYARAVGEGQPWVTEFGPMGAKTCFRRLAKRLPMSSMLRTAVDLDERAEAGVPQDLGAVFDAAAEPPHEPGQAPEEAS